LHETRRQPFPGGWAGLSELPKTARKVSAAIAEYARNTLRKDKRLNIRISERDLI
jgi:hypothetical protein